MQLYRTWTCTNKCKLSPNLHAVGIINKYHQFKYLDSFFRWRLVMNQRFRCAKKVYSLPSVESPSRESNRQRFPRISEARQIHEAVGSVPASSKKEAGMIKKAMRMTGVISTQARNTQHTRPKESLSPLHAHDREIAPEVPRIAPTDRQSISQTGQRGIDAVVNVLVEGDHTLLYFRIRSRE